jgi:hypothetical protein
MLDSEGGILLVATPGRPSSASKGRRLGAVGGGAHAQTEHVRVDRMADRAALLSGLIGELLPRG